MKRLLIIIGIALCLAVAAHTQSRIEKLGGWRLASLGEKDIAVLYNKDRIIQVTSDIKRVWTKSYQPPNTRAKYRYVLSQADYNCTLAETRVVYTGWYHVDGSLYRESQAITRWQRIFPGTIGDHLFRIICKGEKSVDDEIEDAATEHYKRGQEYERQKQYDLALKSYGLANALDEDNEEYKQSLDRIKAILKKPE
jgi:tetratricopeptide (TPR) repeat protein